MVWGLLRGSIRGSIGCGLYDPVYHRCTFVMVELFLYPLVYERKGV